jgi:DNA-binding transcriptional regulator YbjK
VTRHYFYSAPVTPTRTRALDAAIDLLATEGMRALTHGRIDQRAGIPRGSTSNYFRTRSALLGGVVRAIVERELPPVGTAFAPASAAQLVDALCGLLEYVTGHNRTLTTARLVLFMEASHDAALREELSHGRAAIESTMVPALARLGAKDPATAGTAIAACLEGLILHRIARHDDSDPRPTLALVVQAALS